jgi:hypothetical protein
MATSGSLSVEVRAVRLDTELPAGIEQAVEQVLAGRPLAVQQVGGLAVPAPASSRTTSVAILATDVRNAVPSGVTESSRSIAHTFARAGRRPGRSSASGRDRA